MRRHLASALFCLCLAPGAVACKSNEVDQSNNTTNNFNSIGAQGGVVEGPNGVRLEIPPGALRDPVTVGISIATVAEPIPGGTVAGELYEFSPVDLNLLVDATISMPSAPGRRPIYTHSDTTGWNEFLYAEASESGVVEFRVKKLARFAVLAPTPPRDFGARSMGDIGSGDMLATGGEVFWWKSNAPAPGGSLKSFALSLESEPKTVYAEPTSRAIIAAADTDWLYFHRQTPDLGLGRVRRDGSSSQPGWMADAEAKGIGNGGTMLAANGYLYQGFKRIDVATNAVSDHSFGGQIIGPPSFGIQGCAQSPDRQRARCGWGEVDFGAGTSATRTTDVHVFAANATHWFVAPTTKPHTIKMEVHGTEGGVDTALVPREPTKAYLGVTSTHAYLVDCSVVYWIELANPTVLHTEWDVDYNCIYWVHVDEQYMYYATSVGAQRIELSKLRSPT